MQDPYPVPPGPLSSFATSALLAGALLVTGAITTGVASLYGSRPADPSALLSEEHTPLVVTATRLKWVATASSKVNLPLPQPHQPKPECRSIAC